MQWKKIAWYVLACAALVPWAGCSKSTMSEVSGAVTLDGKAIEQGSMNFTPLDGKTQTAGCDIKSGRYTARVPHGKMKVSITSPVEVGKKKLYNTPDSPVQAIYGESVPEKYNTKTELTLDVIPGANQKDFALQSK